MTPADTPTPDGRHLDLIALPHTGLQVPHTRLRMAQLTPAVTAHAVVLTATLYLDGRPVGTVEDLGQGGPTTWHPLPGTTDVFTARDLAAFTAACRDEHGAPIATEFVLTYLIAEAQIDTIIAEICQDNALPVRRLEATADDDVLVTVGDYPDGLHEVSAAWTGRLDQLAAALWRQWPTAGAIDVWTDQHWQRLNKPRT